MFDLKGKKALVTGSTQGIGFAIASCLAEHGAKVFVHGATSMEKSKAAAEKIKGSTPICVNLSKTGAAQELYKATGDVDLLILNASVQIRAHWDEITDEDANTQLRTNFISSLEAMQVYAEGMKKKGFGRIITVGSVQQYRPHVDMAVYAASKCAQMSLVKNVGKQLAPFGITVNNISPGVIATPRNEAALNDDNYRAKVLEGIPAGRAGSADEISGAALLLCSDEGAYIIGTDIVVDGGMSL